MACSSRSPLLVNSVMPFSLIYPRRICQSLVISSSDKEEEVTITSLVTIEHCKTYNLTVFLCPFITTREPLLIFRALHSVVYLCPLNQEYLTRSNSSSILASYLPLVAYSRNPSTKFKNRKDALKKEWKAWKKLKGKDTGLGWNLIKRIVDASDDWWESRLKVVPQAQKFRTSSIDPEFEGKLDQMFIGIVATGDKAWAPSLGTLLSKFFEDDDNDILEENEEENLINDVHISMKFTLMETIKKGKNTLGKNFTF
ncbi:hypothetical protein GOBAR_DD00483 [Gossypium barbadense]|nr:hypothetical protein GOBAR_DD00483 [Gossypium barbadense]